MKAWKWILTALACLPAIGCQQNAQMRAYVDQLNTEQRLVEDDYYTLLSDYRYLDDEAKQLEQENSVLRKRLGLTPTDPIVTTPAETAPAAPSAEPPTLETPEIDLGVPEGPPGLPGFEVPNAPRQLPDGGRLPAETVPGGTVPGGAAARPTPAEQHIGADQQAEDEQEAFTPPDDLRVTHIVINPVLTSGHNFDRRAGDDGVSVVFEPRNAGDQFVPRAGEVAIVVLDPAVGGEAQRVARWDFPLEEALHRLRTEKFGRGLNFKLRWPDAPPEHSRLHVFVRYTSDDGRVLEDNREIEIADASDVSHRWTPKGQPSPSAGASDAATSADGDESKRIRFGSTTSSPRDGGADSGGQHSVLTTPERMPAPRETGIERTAPPRADAEQIGAPPQPVWSPERP